jgi:hypothetical protein
MLPGPVIIRAVLMALAVPRTRLRPSVPDAGRRARSLGLAAADAAAVTR